MIGDVNLNFMVAVSNVNDVRALPVSCPFIFMHVKTQ